MLAISAICALCSYFSFYPSIFRYLPDLVGYSIITNLFMISVYMNKRYCDATKVCVLGLIALNMFSLISYGFEFYAPVYDLYIITIIFIVAILIKRKK